MKELAGHRFNSVQVSRGQNLRKQKLVRVGVVDGVDTERFFRFINHIMLQFFRVHLTFAFQKGFFNLFQFEITKVFQITQIFSRLPIRRIEHRYAMRA